MVVGENKEPIHKKGGGVKERHQVVGHRLAYQQLHGSPNLISSNYLNPLT